MHRTMSLKFTLTLEAAESMVILVNIYLHGVTSQKTVYICRSILICLWNYSIGQDRKIKTRLMQIPLLLNNIQGWIFQI